MLTDYKHRLAASAFRISRLQRIHIIGCARSGTTFLQYCMLAYRNTVVVNAETSPLHPSLGDKLLLSGRALTKGGQNYVTKRPFEWFDDEGISELLDSVKWYNVGIIQILRDPRTVLRSKHRLSADPGQPYVDEERWYASVVAGERIWEYLSDYPRKCTIRYEDLILDPDKVHNVLANTFQLEKVDGVGAINQAKTNAELVGYKVSKAQREAMHGLRNADPLSVKANPEEFPIESDKVKEKYSSFLRTYYN
jgi:hypothetical protein